MISAEVIRDHLIGRLEPIYGKAKNADALSAELAKHAPEAATEADLHSLADRMIETRKAKGMPAASELIAAVKGSVTGGPVRVGASRQQQELERERLAEMRAKSLLRGDPLAKRAVEERWAPALLQFVRKNGRLPQLDEEGSLISLSQRNDVDARAATGPMGPSLRALREWMHFAAARDVGFPVAPPAEVRVTRQSKDKPLTLDPDLVAQTPDAPLAGRKLAAG